MAERIDVTDIRETLPKRYAAAARAGAARAPIVTVAERRLPA
jgi:hypothetical protein